MKNSNGVSCFSTPDLSVVSENATGCNPFTRPCPIACRRVGGAIINSSTPRVLCRSNTSSTNRPRFCKNPGADSNPPQAIFQPTTGPLIVAAERIIWDCSAEAWHEITRWRMPFVKRGDLFTVFNLSSSVFLGIFLYLWYWIGYCNLTSSRWGKDRNNSSLSFLSFPFISSYIKKSLISTALPATSPCAICESMCLASSVSFVFGEKVGHLKLTDFHPSLKQSGPEESKNPMLARAARLSSNKSQLWNLVRSYVFLCSGSAPRYQKCSLCCRIQDRCAVFRSTATLLAVGAPPVATNATTNSPCWRHYTHSKQQRFWQYGAMFSQLKELELTFKLCNRDDEEYTLCMQLPLIPAVCSTIWQ